MTDNIISAIPNERGDILASMMFGNSDLLDDDVRATFSSVGISHIVVASGLHLAIISQAILALALALKTPRRIAYIIAIISALLFAALAGFAPSVTRAVFMISVYYSACIFGKRYDSANSLGAAAIVILLINPFSVMDVSFLLSFFAMVGITCIAPMLIGKLPEKITDVKLVKSAATITVQTFCVMIATLPVIIIFFGVVNLLTPLANLLILPIVALTIIFGFLLAIFAAVPFIGGILVAVCGVLTGYIYFIADGLAVVTETVFSVDKTYIWVWVLICAVVWTVYRFAGKKGVRLTTASVIICIFTLVSGTLIYEVTADRTIKMAVFETADDPVMVYTQDKTAIIAADSFAASDIYDITEYLRRQDVNKISAIITASYSADIVTVVNLIGASFPVDNVITKLVGIESTMEHRADVVSIEPGMKVDFFQRLSFGVLDDGKSEYMLSFIFDGKTGIFYNDNFMSENLSEDERSYDIMLANFTDAKSEDMLQIGSLLATTRSYSYDLSNLPIGVYDRVVFTEQNKIIDISVLENQIVFRSEWSAV